MKKKKVMKLIDPSTGEMECKLCGATHWALIKPGGGYFRGTWQCQYGCSLDSPAESELMKVPINRIIEDTVIIK